MDKVTTAVLIERIEGLKKFFEEKINTTIEVNKEAHDAILVQTTKTNGSVAACKNEIGNLQRKWNYAKGFAYCMMAIVIPVIFILLKALLDKK